MITTEIRYFFEGPINLPLRKIIDQLPLTYQGLRVDNYLPSEQISLTSLKWREERLELKSLVEKQLVGGYLLEDWEKREVGNLAPDTSKWWKVVKKRWLCFFNPEMHILSEASGENYGQLELSEVFLFKKQYHSINLEVMGNAHQIRQVLLLKILQHIANDFPEFPLKLQGIPPQSYPSFLLSAQ